MKVSYASLCELTHFVSPPSLVVAHQLRAYISGTFLWESRFSVLKRCKTTRFRLGITGYVSTACARFVDLVRLCLPRMSSPLVTDP